MAQLVTDFEKPNVKLIVGGLEFEQRKVCEMILRVPTGEARNELADANIHLLAAIERLNKVST